MFRPYYRSFKTHGVLKGLFDSLKLDLELSIVIVNYNAGHHLAEAANSVWRTTQQLSSPTCEIVVVDNHSTDASINKLKETDVQYELLRNRENLGFAKAANQGIKEASGEYILLLNPDTIVQKGAIERLMRTAEEQADVGVVGGKLINPDGSVQPSVFHFPSISGAVKEYWLGHTGAYAKYAPEVDAPIEVDAVVGAVFLLTPLARAKVGLLDECYFMYFEDLDYCRRVNKTALRVLYEPRAEFVHYHGVSGKSLEVKAQQWKRLIPGSKLYNGVVKHYLLALIIWSGTKLRNFTGTG